MRGCYRVNAGGRSDVVFAIRALLVLLILPSLAHADRRGLTGTFGVGGALVRVFDDPRPESGFGYASGAGSLGGFVSPRLMLGGRIEATYGRTFAGRDLFVVAVGPTAELWASERWQVGAGMSLLVVGLEPFDILVSRGLALPARVSLRPGDGPFRATLAISPAFFREEAVLLHVALLAEWGAW